LAPCRWRGQSRIWLARFEAMAEKKMSHQWQLLASSEESNAFAEVASSSKEQCAATVEEGLPDTASASPRRVTLALGCTSLMLMTSAAVFWYATSCVETVHVTKPWNKPSLYRSYLKPTVESLVRGAPPNVSDYEPSEAAAGSWFSWMHHTDDEKPSKTAGSLLFTIVGSCPSTFCGNEVTYFSRFAGTIKAYWAKPGDLQECTQDRHVAGECKNDTDRFKQFQGLIDKVNEGKVLKAEDNKLLGWYDEQWVHVYMLYVMSWETLAQTCQGFVFYKRLGSHLFFRKQFKASSDWKITLFGEEANATKPWPSEEHLVTTQRLCVRRAKWLDAWW